MTCSVKLKIKDNDVSVYGIKVGFLLLWKISAKEEREAFTGCGRQPQRDVETYGWRNFLDW